MIYSREQRESHQPQEKSIQKGGGSELGGKDSVLAVGFRGDWRHTGRREKE